LRLNTLPHLRAVILLPLIIALVGLGALSVSARIPQARSGAAALDQIDRPGAPNAPASGQLPAFSHVFVIVLENKEASTVLGSPAAPYFNELAAQYARAGNYYAVTHPSLPNYLALTGGSTFGVTTDCTTCYVSADNIAVQVEDSGRSWKAYLESLPNPCYTRGSGNLYVQRHDPFMYYDNIRGDQGRCQNVVPLTQLQTDLQAGTAPNFAWISPNLCSDMHNCPIATGDAWLKTWIPRILASPAWQQNGVLFVLFDEGESSRGCCAYAAGGNVAALVISPLVRPGYVSTVAYDHYSLLRTIEEAWRLPLLGKAGSSATASMVDFFQANGKVSTGSPSTNPGSQGAGLP
jgi:phosphatidylinositol-3-phosphatase